MNSLKNLPGVGEKTLEKLKESGYCDLMEIAAASPNEIMERADLGDSTCGKIIQAARDALDIGFQTADKLLEKRKQIQKITTCSKNLDDLLGGGIETGCLIEAHGAFGSSKTQLGLQLAVSVQLPKEKGGLDKGCVFIDTEGTFRPERVLEMGKALEINKKELLSRIYIGRVFNSDHQIIVSEKLDKLIREKNIGLVVVDSLTSQFRSDYTGRGTLAVRQQKLNRHLHTFQKLADVYNIAVYLTNQVMARPDVLFGDPTSPIGGHILGHQATFRVYFRKSKKEKRIARLIDSPHLPEGESIFKVCKEGIRDP